MRAYFKPLVAIIVLMSLGACATTDGCPSGTHPGPGWHRCHPDR